MPLTRRHLFTAVGASLFAFAPRQAAAVPTPPGRLITLNPAERWFDSREPGGLSGKFSAGDARTVAIGVNPTGFTGAVFLNLTITQTEGAGFVRAYPADESDFPPVQHHSNINWSEDGQTLANLVLTQVGQESGVVFECGGAGRTHIVVDVMGYVPFYDTP